MRSAPSDSPGLSADAIRAVRLVGPGAAEVERVMVDWFTSPFWLSDTSVASWFASGRDVTRAVPKVLARVAESELSVHIRDVSVRPWSFERPLALADRYLVDPYPADRHLAERYSADPDSPHTPPDLRAVTAACAAGSTTHALIWSGDGLVVSASVPSLMAIVVAESVGSCVRYPVDHGIRRLLGSPRRYEWPVRLARRRPLLPQGATVVGVACLLPTTGGMALRSNLVASAASGVPVALYPLVAALVPEVSGDLVPLIRPRGLMPSPTSSAAVWAVSPVGAAAWSLGLAVRSPADRARRFGYRLGASALRRVHPLTRTTLAVRVLTRLGIDSTASRGLVTRLRSGRGTNPWLGTRERGSATFQVVHGDGAVVHDGDRSGGSGGSGGGSNRDVEVAPC